MNDQGKKLRICLTGATGFIGKNLLEKLKLRDDLEVVALSRKISPDMDGASKGNVIWKRCNGFNLLDVEKATEDCDIIIYLIHSMLPSSTLTQGNFLDFDLILADNFARAAKKNSVKKIIYLSGIIPQVEKLSDHLKSRLEVEKVLAEFETDLTVLRAGLIVGKDGSSFKILDRLIKRLPLLICPAWTKTKTQPIDIQDVLASLIYCIDNYRELSPVYDIGGPDVLSYKEMLTKTAKASGRKRLMFSVPLFSPGLSKMWVSKVASVPKNLVYPLVDSLKYQMTVDPDKQLIVPNHQYMSFEDSLKKGVSGDSGNWVRIIINYNTKINLRWLENVTSIQRIKAVNLSDAEEIASVYFSWLPRFLRPFISVKSDNGTITFCFCMKLTLLKLEKKDSRSSETRVIYFVRGGILAREQSLNGRIEFRSIKGTNDTLIALLDFRPSLPWFVYKFTQALVHLCVMKNFKKYLEREYAYSKQAT